MQGFEWAVKNLSVRTPYELESKGVNVFFAPHITPDVRVVDLSDGKIRGFSPDDKRPSSGYYAELESMKRYCSENGASLGEEDGAVSLARSDS